MQQGLSEAGCRELQVRGAAVNVGGLSGSVVGAIPLGQLELGSE